MFGFKKESRLVVPISLGKNHVDQLPSSDFNLFDSDAYWGTGCHLVVPK